MGYFIMNSSLKNKFCKTRKEKLTVNRWQIRTVSGGPTPHKFFLGFDFCLHLPQNSSELNAEKVVPNNAWHAGRRKSRLIKKMDTEVLNGENSDKTSPFPQELRRRVSTVEARYAMKQTGAKSTLAF